MFYAGPGDVVNVFDGPNYGDLWVDRFPIAIVAHTTETLGRPDYVGGSTAPQITIDPAKQVVWQHQPLDRRGGSLRGSTRVLQDTGVRAVMNEKALQVELIGYSDRNTVIKHGGGRRWVGDFGDADYEFIAAVIHYLKNLFDVGDDLHARPSGRSWSAGISSPHRLGAKEWEQLNGFTAHGGVFGQIHWDTGVLDLNRIWRGDDLMTPEQKRNLDWLAANKPVIDRIAKMFAQDSVSSWAEPSWKKAVARGMIRNGTAPGEPVTVERMATFIDRRGLLEDGQLWTKAKIMALVAAGAGAGASASEVIAEIARRLGG